MEGRLGGGQSALHPGERNALARFDAVTRVSLQAQIVHRAFRPLWWNGLFLDLFAFDSPRLARAEFIALFDEDTQQNPRAAWRQLANGRACFGERRMRDARGRAMTVEMMARRVAWDGGPAVAQAFRAIERGPEPHTRAPLLLVARSPALAQAAHDELARAQFVVIRAASYDDAVAKAHRRVFACALIEVGAGFAHGQALCARLRTFGPMAANPPLIALCNEADGAKLAGGDPALTVDAVVERRNFARRLAQTVCALVGARD